MPSPCACDSTRRSTLHARGRRNPSGGRTIPVTIALPSAKTALHTRARPPPQSLPPRAVFLYIASLSLLRRGMRRVRCQSLDFPGTTRARLASEPYDDPLSCILDHWRPSRRHRRFRSCIAMRCFACRGSRCLHRSILCFSSCGIWRRYHSLIALMLEMAAWSSTGSRSLAATGSLKCPPKFSPRRRRDMCAIVALPDTRRCQAPGQKW